jgi:hypothetical protein
MSKLTSEKISERIQENLGKLANTVTNHVCSSGQDYDAICERLKAIGYNNLSDSDKILWKKCSCK